MSFQTTLGEDILKMSIEDIVSRTRLLDNDIKVSTNVNITACYGCVLDNEKRDITHKS